MKPTSNLLFGAMIAILATSSNAFGQSFDGGTDTSNQEVNGFLRYLGQINRYSPIEGAGSHGSIGGSIGAGVNLLPESETSALHQRHLYMEEADGSGSLVMPKLYLIKGLQWPVDLGLSLGNSQQGHISQASGHVQWTAYEDFRMPALALRASYSRMFGLADAGISSLGVDAAVSYGFLRYFGIYAAYGVQHHIAHVSMDQQDGAVYFIAPEERPLTVDERWFTTSKVVGASVTVLPPFVSGSMEMQVSNDEDRVYAAKLSLGM